MKSVTLTKQMREDILASVMDKWKEKNPSPDVHGAANTFAEWLWNDKYKKIKNKLIDVPKEFLNTSEELKFCVDGQVEEVSFSDGNEKPVDWTGYRRPVLKTITSSHKEYSKYEKVKEQYEEWKDSGYEVRRETKAILESVNTTRQLLELWPQCEPFLPAHIADPDKSIRLPAIEMSRLNERIGLD